MVFTVCALLHAMKEEHIVTIQRSALLSSCKQERKIGAMKELALDFDELAFAWEDSFFRQQLLS